MNKIICIDLMETLIGRDDAAFCARLSELLSLPPSRDAFVTKTVRQRYLEYSMGNYGSDGEYLSVLLLSLAGRPASKEEIQAAAADLLGHYRAIEGSIGFLKTLKELDCRVCIASNFVTSWAVAILDRLGMTPYTDDVFISSDLRVRKPAPAFFLHIADTLGVPPQEVTFIGNSYVNDYLGAKNVGMEAYLLKENNTEGEGLCYDEIASLLKKG